MEQIVNLIDTLIKNESITKSGYQFLMMTGGNKPRSVDESERGRIDWEDYTIECYIGNSQRNIEKAFRIWKFHEFKVMQFDNPEVLYSHNPLEVLNLQVHFSSQSPLELIRWLKDF